MKKWTTHNTLLLTSTLPGVFLPVTSLNDEVIAVQSLSLAASYISQPD